LKSLRSIWVVGERDIFAELAQMIAIATEANSLVKSMFRMDYEEKALIEIMQVVKGLEKKSDEVAFNLGEKITSGAVSPNILDSLLECVHVADNLVDTYYYLSRELYRMSKAKSANFEIHQETTWASVYESLLSLAEKSLSKLEKTLSTANISEILELRKQIEAIEEQGDDIKDAGFDKLYSVGPELHYLQFHHYSQLLHKCDDLLDSCEDFSDLIVSIVTSILK
jgi:uncharacterized protein